MTTISTVPPESLEGSAAELAAANEFYGIVAHRPEILEAWAALDAALADGSSVLSGSLKEEARRTLAQDVGCVFCKSLGTPKESHPDRREALAVALADMIATDHRQIDASVMEALRAEFSEPELVELLTSLCFKYCSNIFGSMMDLAPATPEQVDQYALFVAGGEYA